MGLNTKCPECGANMKPTLGANGLPIWKCPPCYVVRRISGASSAVPMSTYYSSESYESILCRTLKEESSKL